MRGFAEQNVRLQPWVAGFFRVNKIIVKGVYFRTLA